MQKKGKILVPYISNFWRTVEIPLITCEINLNLNWSKKCVIVVTDVANQGATFSMTDAKLYVPVITLGKCKTAWTIKIWF